MRENTAADSYKTVMIRKLLFLYMLLLLNFDRCCCCRWVKYEEDVEENGKRWSKPHVASVTLHNVFELKSQMAMGAIMLECEGKSIPQLAGMF